jgi:flagellum-specific ATP synthase
MKKTSLCDKLTLLASQVEKLRLVDEEGRVGFVSNSMLRISGISCEVSDTVASGAALAEVVSIDQKGCTAVPLTQSVPTLGDPATRRPLQRPAIGRSWLGRTVDFFGQPLDHGPKLPFEAAAARSRHGPAGPFGARLDCGIGLLNTFLPLARGQRIGIFASPGVGKSRLLHDLGTRVDADVVVWALIGERSRELATLAQQVHGATDRNVIVASLANEPAAAKRRGAEMAMTIAEGFAERGAHVLLLFDSLTRFAQAHRECALAAGEPPALEAYPPSTITALSALCERAGCRGSGSVTAVLAVLVENGDMAGAVADGARSVLDGHIVLDRAIAERGRFPAIDVLRSISRCLPEAASEAENALLCEARAALALYDNVALLVRMGAYTAGSDAEVDRAVRLAPHFEQFFADPRKMTIADSFAALKAVMERKE